MKIAYIPNAEQIVPVAPEIPLDQIPLIEQYNTVIIILLITAIGFVAYFLYKKYKKK